MGKGAQALRVCLGVGLKMTTQAPESGGGEWDTCAKTASSCFSVGGGRQAACAL